jgi:hypothetical protein
MGIESVIPTLLGASELPLNHWSRVERESKTNLSLLVEGPLSFAEYIAEFHERCLDGHVRPSDDANVLQLLADGVGGRHDTPRTLRYVDDEDSAVCRISECRHDVGTFQRRLEKGTHLYPSAEQIKKLTN